MRQRYTAQSIILLKNEKNVCSSDDVICVEFCKASFYRRICVYQVLCYYLEIFKEICPMRQQYTSQSIILQKNDFL